MYCDTPDPELYFRLSAVNPEAGIFSACMWNKFRPDMYSDAAGSEILTFLKKFML
jgi:hypothetical protein